MSRTDTDQSERHDGMGALIHQGGVAFRVWAPHADAVGVVGDFNDWDASRNPMTSEGEGDGYWYADVAEAHPGHGYKYLITNGEQELYRIDPYARQVTNSVGHGLIYDHTVFDWQDDGFTCPPHNELVIYEAHIGSFDPQQDGTGTFDDLRARLGYLERLGINALQLMPVAEFAGDMSWGYNPAHVFAVESAYGGPDALKSLVLDAHRRGIAVILDVVYNHFGPSDLDLWQFDGWSDNGKGGIYFFNDERSSTPWGDTRPDYGREEVRRFIHDNALSWLSDYHLDGLRLDMTLYMRSIDGNGAMDIPEGWELTRWINRDVRERFPGRIMIAEDLQSDHALTSTGDDGACFHAQWDAEFVHPVRAALTETDDAERSIGALAAAVRFSYGDAFSRVVYTESHDEVSNGKARVPYEVHADDPTGWHAQKRSTLGAALTLTAPGIPMLFQGQEFLQGEWFRDDVPLDWQLREDFRGIVRLYRDLNRLRRNLDGWSRGLTGQHVEVVHADEDTNVLAYHRWYEGGPGDDVLVIANVDHRAHEHLVIAVPHAGRWALRVNTDAAVYSDIFEDLPASDLDVAVADDGVGAVADVSIGPYSALIYTRVD